MEKLMKLIEKKRKEGKEMHPLEKEAKMNTLHALRNEMSGMMKHDLMHPAHKVEVGASSPEGLEHGLEKAKELLHGMADHDANSDELGQDEADEHKVDDEEDGDGVDAEMEEHAEEGEDDREPEHEGEQDAHEHAGEEEHDEPLSDEEHAHLQHLLKRSKKHHRA